MMRRRSLAAAGWTAAWVCTTTALARGADLIPPLAEIRQDRPRVLLRPKATPHAISLAQLKDIPRDGDFDRMLSQLRGERNAAAQAMVWLLTGDDESAKAAVRSMRGYTLPESTDTFHIYFRLCEFGLAYDWLWDYEGFTDPLKAEVRGRILPLARRGLKVADDHMFHNYIWMSAGGVAIWALATAGEDDDASRLFERIRHRFNDGLYPAWRYLDGLPSEPMGYWALYVLSPGVLALLGAQSAFERDLVGAVRDEQGDWLARHFENLVHSTLPDMRYIPWGDLQSGPNGGVTHEMAGLIDALTWALGSRQGAYLSRWITGKRGLRRFHGETAIFYMIYTRHVSCEPATPPPSFFAGGEHGGHFIARSGWDGGATVVALTATDHFGDHHHYDQGSFVIYRRGLLAVDPPIYRRIRGPQQRTENHNTLLIGGEVQRPVRGQWFVTVEDFRKNLEGGRRLETGAILSWKEGGGWASVAAQFAQAYPAGIVESCVRQLLFVRPDRVVVVDHLVAPPEKLLPEVEWLLHLPAAPAAEGSARWASNGNSWIRCRPLFPGRPDPVVSSTDVNTHRLRLAYPGGKTLTVVHLLEVGDGPRPTGAARAEARPAARSVEVELDGTRYVFPLEAPYDLLVR